MRTAGIEIERKFLVAEEPKGLHGAASSFIRQGYLAAGPVGEVRLRDEDGVLTLTAKSGGGRQRGEHEIELSKEQFDMLWPATKGGQIEKTRYRLRDGAITYEIDVYAGTMQGLRVVEVEFASSTEAETFAPPPWFGPEVTDDARYKNASLAFQGRPDEGAVRTG